MEPTTDKRNQIIATIIIAVLILIAIAYFFSRSVSQPSSGNTATSTATTTLATSTSGGVSTTSSSGTYTVKQISGDTTPTAPNYKAPLNITAPGISADERTSLQSQFAVTEASIASNKTDFDAWIALGSEREQAGDYAGAAADWQYISEIYPTNVVSNANLGDLYTNDLMNYPRAAAAFEAQIAIDPTDVYIYSDLFSLYTNQYPQGAAVATAILKQGIAANPKATNLMVILARYYKSTGDITDAKTEYSAAIASAQAQGNTSAVTQLQQEATTP